MKSVATENLPEKLNRTLALSSTKLLSFSVVILYYTLLRKSCSKNILLETCYDSNGFDSYSHWLRVSEWDYAAETLQTHFYRIMC